MDARHVITRGKRERPRNRQGEGGRLRAELMAAASRLLAQGVDPEAMSLRAVAREAGVAAPSVYLQFDSKEDLLRAVITANFAMLQNAIEAAVAMAEDPASRLFAGCLAYCQFAIDQPGAYRVIFETRLPVWGDRAVEDQPGMSAFQLLVDAVAGCIDAGLANPGDPFQIATDIWVALHGMVSLRQRLPGFPWPPIERQLTSVLRALTGVDPTDAGSTAQ